MPFSPRSFGFLAVFASAAFAVEAPPFPQAVVTGVTVELVAQEPDVCTPTAIAADAQGRVWVLQNNSHFRPKNYDGPPTDRVLILDDFAPDGRARKITTYADGFMDGMSLLLLPDGDLILSTRAETIRFHDKDGDGRADERRTLLKLTTEDKYPHDGLTGIALGPDGYVYLGFGENHGQPWTLTGTDGATVSGADEGGVFRCDPEGRQLAYWALGVWNLFGLAFDPTGRLFALDNDPGAGSFCRLLHIVKGGDYGYRYRYKTMDHVFNSWEGRWPGSLPPVCLSGEAPTGLLWLGDSLLGCTWNDFGVQRFRLDPRGASFGSQPDWIVRGDHRFRPPGLAKAPDGSLVVSDWADAAYELHGKGRVWRIRGYKPNSTPLAPNADEQKLSAILAGQAKPSAMAAQLGSSDPFLRLAAVEALAPVLDQLLDNAGLEFDPAVRLGVLLTAKHSTSPQRLSRLADWLKDSDPAIRRAAIQWVADERLQDYAARLDSALEGKVTRVVFDAYVAALDHLAASAVAGKPDPFARYAQVLRLALDEKRDAELRALALRLLPTEHPGLTVEKLRALIASAAPVRTEAVRILATRHDPVAQAELRALAPTNADAIAGLALSAPDSEDTRAVLRQLLTGSDIALAREALRSLGFAATAEDIAKLKPEPPSAGVSAATVLAATGDPIAGRRLFFHPNGPGCFNCHQIEGRGRAIGPELTHLRFTPEQILTAIREPSKDIAPIYLTWHVKTRDGSEGAGIDIFRNNTAQFVLIDANAKTTTYKYVDVIERTALPISLMPPALLDRFSVREAADLLAYLRESRE
jgi:putative membrane-bound dehydrogenase-like protein